MGNAALCMGNAEACLEWGTVNLGIMLARVWNPILRLCAHVMELGVLKAGLC